MPRIPEHLHTCSSASRCVTTVHLFACICSINNTFFIPEKRLGSNHNGRNFRSVGSTGCSLISQQGHHMDSRVYLPRNGCPLALAVTTCSHLNPDSSTHHHIRPENEKEEHARTVETPWLTPSLLLLPLSPCSLSRPTPPPPSIVRAPQLISPAIRCFGSSDRQQGRRSPPRTRRVLPLGTSKRLHSTRAPGRTCRCSALLR